VSTGGPPAKVNVGYNPLTDPHLYDYFVRKLTSMDPLMPAQPSQVDIEDSLRLQFAVVCVRFQHGSEIPWWNSPVSCHCHNHDCDIEPWGQATHPCCSV